MRARFWHRHNYSWVKISLLPGESIQLVEGGPDEEGYSYTQTTFEHQGLTVVRYTEIFAKDCDGRFSSAYQDSCAILELRCFVADDGTLLPNWREEDSLCRDYTAEAMGY